MTRFRVGTNFLAAAGLITGVTFAAVPPKPAATTTAVLYVATENPAASDTGHCQTAATPCLTLTYAVSQAEELTTSAVIEAAEGTYYGNLSISEPKSLTLVIEGASPYTDVRPSSSTGTGTVITINRHSGAVWLYGLDITGGGGSGAGGGVVNNGTTVLLNDGIIDNQVGSSPLPGGGAVGGGIANYGALYLAYDSIANNAATVGGTPDGGSACGGGLYNAPNATATVEDSTFSDNSAGVIGDGGAVCNSGTASFLFATFATNSEGISNAGTMTVANTLLADEADGHANCGGTAVTSGGYNMADDSGCAGMSAANHDQLNVSDTAINLGPSYVPGPGSAALHQVPLANCKIPGAKVPEDQRGVPRPQPPAAVQGASAACDIGAFEYAPPVITSLAPNKGPAGTNVTIHGYGFTLVNPVGSVFFGNTAVSSYQVVSDTKITTTAPPGSESVSVKVVNTDGTTTPDAADLYTYTASG